MTLDLDYYAGLAAEARKYCLQYSHLVKATEGNASQAHVRLTADELSALVEMARGAAREAIRLREVLSLARAALQQKDEADD